MPLRVLCVRTPQERGDCEDRTRPTAAPRARSHYKERLARQGRLRARASASRFRGGRSENTCSSVCRAHTTARGEFGLQAERWGHAGLRRAEARCAMRRNESERCWPARTPAPRPGPPTVGCLEVRPVDGSDDTTHHKTHSLKRLTSATDGREVRGIHGQHGCKALYGRSEHLRDRMHQKLLQQGRQSCKGKDMPSKRMPWSGA